MNDHELVVAGVAQLLGQYPQLVEVRQRIVIGEPIDDGTVDVALYDTYGRADPASALAALVAAPQIGAVAVFSLDLPDQLIADGREAGAAGFISKALDGADIVAAVVAVARGEAVVARARSAPSLPAPLTWPGQVDGLSVRQSQVLALAAEGLTNREIAASLYLSFETVKSYLRDVFAKLGFRNRAEAIAYVHRSMRADAPHPPVIERDASPPLGSR